MLRLLIAFIIIVALAALAAWAADNPGTLVIDWAGYHIETSIGAAIVLLVIFTALVALLYRGWRWLRKMPRNVKSALSDSRVRKGHNALSRGLIAVASGDVKEAKQQAARADRLLENPTLSLLLSAQAAQLAGDEKAATGKFQEMLENPETEFLGLRGLLVQAERRGDRQEALRLVRRAESIQPNAKWVAESSFQIQAEAGQWRDASRALENAKRQNIIDKDTAKRNRAVLLLGQAQDAHKAGQTKDAIKHANSALKSLPGFVPAALLEARVLFETGKVTQAERVISDAWATTPHPELAEFWNEMHADLNPAEALQKVEILANRNEDNSETQLLKAQAAFAAHDWSTARQSLDKVLAATDVPDTRICRLMADFVEQYSGDAGEARDWLHRAATAPEAGRWLCTLCGHDNASYETRCPSCGAFDSMRPKDQESVEAAARNRSLTLIEQQQATSA